MREDIINKVIQAEKASKKSHGEWQLRCRAMSRGICPECGGVGRESTKGVSFFSFWREFHTYKFNCLECGFAHSEVVTD